MEFPLTDGVIVLGDIVHTWQCLCAGVRLAISKYAQSLLQSLLLGAQVKYQHWVSRSRQEHVRIAVAVAEDLSAISPVCACMCMHMSF